jgi:hypothetical protein
VARAALPGSRRCRTRERPRRRLQGSPPLARSVDLSGLWWSNGVGLGRPPRPALGVATLRSLLIGLAFRLPGGARCWRLACRTGVLLGVRRPAGVALALRFPWYFAVELRGFEPLTPCMPCHPHHLTRSSAASPGTTSVVLSPDAGRGAVVLRENGWIGQCRCLWLCEWLCPSMWNAHSTDED